MIQPALKNLLFVFSFICLSGVVAPTMVLGQDESDRATTGGAQTLEDIMNRQNGVAVEEGFRREQNGEGNTSPELDDALGTRGGTSDAEILRALRFGEADVTVSAGGEVAKVVVQDGGMKWLAFRAGPLMKYSGYFLLGVIVLLGVFYLIRGKIMIDAGLSGQKIMRFASIERFAHWTLATSFVLLAFSGLWVFFGRRFLIPAFGHDFYSTITIGTKWVHGNVSWAFMLALIMVTVLWIKHNIPRLEDIKWLLKGGGLLSKGVHLNARKFNAGQKLIFWGVILLGASVSVSGLSLLFPFELPLFAKTFGMINSVAGALGIDCNLPTVLAPQEEMQLAQLWHVIVAVAMMGMIMAHIYIGTLGMQGAFDAMATGEVDRNWAKEHHNLWVEEVEAKAAATPADTAEESG